MSETSLRRPIYSARALIALLCVFTLSLGNVAHAADPGEDDPEVIAQAKQHYKAGLEAYKAGQYDTAIRELKKAYLLKRLPPLLINIGATYRKMGDLDLSLHFYQKYLDEAPADAKDRGEVEKIVGEIKAQKASAASDENGRAEAPPPPSARRSGGGSESDWNHAVIDAAPPETPIDVRVATAVMKGIKVYVYYRGAGQADFNSVLMKRRGREKVGRIPAEAVNGRSLQYYIEAKDSAGTVVKSAGSQTNPNIIMIEDGVKPVMLASSSRRDEEEEPSEEGRKPRKPQRDLDAEEAPTTGSVNLSDDEPVHTPPRKRKSGGGMSTLMLAGIATAAVGVGVTAVGGAMLGLAGREASALSFNSQNPIDGNGNPIYFNNDPNAGSSQEADRESRGKTYNLVGIIGTTLGGAAIAAGVGCIIADVVMKADAGKPKKKKRKKRRVVEDDEEEESTRWYISPTGGPTSVGVTGGLSF